MFDKIKRLLHASKKNIRQSVKKRIYSDLLPENPLHDDLYLVSFPKSGVTWLMYLIATVNMKMSGLESRVTFFNVENIVPDIHSTKQLKEEILPFPGCRIIKSHSPYHPFYNRIVYLIRDPRDVMVSYFHFAKNLNMFSGNISEFIRSSAFGIELWCRHIDSWTTQVKPHQYINFIRYEDLKSDAKGLIRRIYALLGHDLSEEVIDYAINNSSFNAMRKDEEFYSALNVTLNPDFKFVRKGKAGNYSKELTEEDIQFINRTAQQWIKMFGY